MPDEKSAEHIARELVAAKLAACVNVIPGLKSIYKWNGELQNDSEILLMVKTQRQLFNRVREKIVSLHSYDLPEIIAVNLSDGLKGYLDWIVAQTSNQELH